MIIATAGHVDHGKTSLVNALTGIDTDRLKEEKQRGLTIDLGFAYWDGEAGARMGFVDVPGHTRFINNMLAGVSAIDCALLVVAADDGVMPQTLEHLDILNILGIKNGIIAITKIDRCEPGQLEATIEQVSSTVQNTFLESAEIFPVSAVTGEGIETLHLALEVTADDVERRSNDGQFRLAIDRRFTAKGAGIVVTGSVFSGTASLGDELLLMPQHVPVRVRSLHTQNQESDVAIAGDRCALNITAQGLELEHIHRGNWLTGNPAPATSRADVLLRISTSESRPFTHWTPVHIHSAANHVHGRAALLEPARIEPGEQGLAQLVFEPAINLCFGDRFVIRDQTASRTLGGGRILHVTSPKRGRARPERIALLRQLDPEDPAASAVALVRNSVPGLSMSYLTGAFNFTDAELEEVLAESGLLSIDGQHLVSPENLASLLEQVTVAIENWHREHPGKSGLPKNQVRRFFRNMDQPVFDHLLEKLIEGNQLEQQGNLFRIPGHGVQLSQQETKIWESTLPFLEADLIKPPVLHELADLVKVAPRELEQVLVQVTKTGQLVRPVKNRFFLADAIPALKRAVAQAADDNGQFSVQQYRDETGIGRNLCIELLEYFDRQGFTRRIGDMRQIVGEE